jgi:dihydropteroate synthase
MEMVRWQHAGGVIEWEVSVPLLMGVLNVTPDSFSDGGKFLSAEKAVEQAERLLEAGADLIDIGGESTRPGADPVAVEEECDRVLPVIRTLKKITGDLVISIDTYKAEVARRALEEGAAIINDISAGRWDDAMLDVLADSDAGYICMHASARPGAMQAHTDYAQVAEDIRHFLLERKARIEERGVKAERLLFDVGIGFGKTVEQNLELIRAGMAGRFDSLERPLLWGLSRKSFLGKLTGCEVEKRLSPGLAAHARLLEATHPQVWRVHDVGETRAFLKVWKSISHTH